MRLPRLLTRLRSCPTIHEQLLQELREQNRLLRIDLASRGIAPSRLSQPQIQVTPRKKLTEKDVIVVTRADLLRQQFEDEEREARALPDVAIPAMTADSPKEGKSSFTDGSPASPRSAD